MKKLWLLVGVSVLMLGGSAVEAKVGTGNAWTQLENGNWPANSTDPKCETAPRVCIRWSTNGRNGYFEGYWHYNLVKTESYWKTLSISAIQEWSGQAYRSPVFTHTPSACGQAATHVCITETDLKNAQACADAPNDHYNSGIIFHGWTRLNTTGSPFYDDRKPPPTSGTWCPLHNVLLHELGHNWSEGHSSVKTALMYKATNMSEQVDEYADEELRAVYGALASSGSGGTGCYSASDTSIAYCPSAVLEAKAKLLQEGQALFGLTQD